MGVDMLTVRLLFLFTNVSAIMLKYLFASGLHRPMS
jgi:hypothetical protein